MQQKQLECQDNDYHEYFNFPDGKLIHKKELQKSVKKKKKKSHVYCLSIIHMRHTICKRTSDMYINKYIQLENHKTTAKTTITLVFFLISIIYR